MIYNYEGANYKNVLASPCQPISRQQVSDIVLYMSILDITPTSQYTK